MTLQQMRLADDDVHTLTALRDQIQYSQPLTGMENVGALTRAIVRLETALAQASEDHENSLERPWR